MGKLLAWGNALFFVRCGLGKLQVERIEANAKTKNISLCVCSISSDNEASVLPHDAHLVAANEVEDSAFAMYSINVSVCNRVFILTQADFILYRSHYPILAFTSSQKTELVTQSSFATRKLLKKRRTSVLTDDARLKSSRWLYFFTLSDEESGAKFRLHFLNVLEIPLRISDEEIGVSANNLDTLQVFVMDGPHVLLFERQLRRMTLLRFQREWQHELMRFDIRHQELDMIHDMKSALFHLVSCIYVSELHFSKPHILIHTLSSDSVDSSKGHNWSIVYLDCDGGNNESRTMCHYMPVFPCNGAMSLPEQITCCSFITKLNKWDFTASSFSERNAFAWVHGMKAQSTKTEVGVQTLVITGSTSNTIYVHANGVLLVSYLLPCQPVEIMPLNEDNVDHHHVLCVRCDDADRSVFILKFSSDVQNMSMNLLSTFKQVGAAQVGTFVGMDVFDGFSSTHILLLNEVQALSGTNNDSSWNVEKAEETTDPRQLVERSVLVSKKTSIPEIKLSCRRLRLREKKKSKRDSRSHKRSRSNGDMNPASSKSETFHYVERTHRASARDESASYFEAPKDDLPDGLVASHAQLDKLANSLSTRLKNGLQELQRLQVLMSDKVSLIYQLNQLIIRLSQKIQSRTQNPSNKRSTLTPLLSIRNVANPHFSSRCRADMETIISAIPVPWSTMKDELPTFSDLMLETQVSLEHFNLLEYVSSSSLVYAEVVLRNMSELVVHDCFVVLSAPNGGNLSTHGWLCSSSVVNEFFPSLCYTEQQREVRFQLELRFESTFSFLRERKPFETMLWLHWNASQDDFLSTTNLFRHSSELSAFPIASVKIYPEDLIGKLQTTIKSCLSRNRSSCEGIEQSQLLFISSGSNLSSWFDNLTIEIPTVVDSVIRPQFALLNIRAKSHESMLHVLSRIVANLPPDVYVMQNPFHHTHFRMLQLVLRSMRQEIMITRRNRLPDSDGCGKNHSVEATYKKQTHSRAMQRNTDLQVNLLLHRLQKRVNFHSMWFDGCTKSL